MGNKFFLGQNSGADVNVFISGSTSTQGTERSGTSLFGGDVYVSGTVYLGPSHSSKGVGSGGRLFSKDQDNSGNTGISFETADTIKNYVGGSNALSIGTDGVNVNPNGNATHDFRVESDGNQHMLFVDASTNRIGVGKTGNSPATTVHIKDSSPILRIQRNNNSEDSTLDFAGQSGAVGAVMHLSNSNDLVFKTHNGSNPEEMLRIGAHWGESNRQVIILSGSGMGAGATQPKEAPDIAFFVSGAVGSKNTDRKGAAVFGGDLVVSGAMYRINTLTGLAPNSGYGEIVTLGSTATTPGKLYYYSDTGWTQTGAKVTANGSSQLLGLALGPNSATGMLIKGFAKITVDNQGSSDEGKPAYASTVTGNITGSAPAGAGEFVRLLGWIADDQGAIYFSPSNDWIEL